VAVTVVPEVSPGTFISQENEPEVSVVREPLEQPEIITPSNTREANGVDAENPVPETVSVAPTGPWPGSTVMEGVVTVNVPEAG
jgi:hypothetical protein